MHRISPIYTADFDFDGAITPRLKVMVAAIPRSGSTYFCLDLWRSGAFGAPAEYLNLMNRREDMIPRPHDPSARIQRSASSHFGHGVLTFHLGWLLRTNPGWAVWARGLPNRTKRSITPLEGVVETDWLSFPFTMNWRFVEKGRVRFAAGEPIAYLTIFPHMAIDQVLPTFHEIQDAPALHTAFMDWRDSRNDWNKRLAEGDPAVTKQGWQRKYLRGAHPAQTGAYHVVKRRLNAPVAGLASGCPVSHRRDDSTSTINCGPDDGIRFDEADG
ncbi:DUF6065 family protein [Xanthomonas prunicola]|nr:DUF6065 family protein [Xanthomonas prunicola]UXA61015.1 DUF6065 family protein [Xanthomonas prunicola]